MRGKKLLWALLFLAIGLGGFWRLPLANATAGINKQISFQGKVVSTDGTNVADTTYDFVFSIYTVATAGTAVWTESKSIAVVDGIFQTNLGSGTALPGSVDFNSDTLYLGIEFNSDGEMTPRIRLTAVPYAFNSDQVDGLDAADLLRSNVSDTFSGANGQTLTVESALTVGARSAALLNITQANDVTYDSTGALLAITNSDTGSAGNLVSLSNSGSGAALLFTEGTTVTNGIQWGADANAVTLYRSADDTLKTDDALIVGGALNVTGTTTLATALTGLLEATAGVVGTATADVDYQQVITWGDGLEYATGTAAVDYNTTNLKITATELNTIQDIATASSPTFANLTDSGLTATRVTYAGTAGILQDSASMTFDATNGLTLAAGSASALNLSSTAGTAVGGILLGTDTNLYRSAANTLKTDSTLIFGDAPSTASIDDSYSESNYSTDTAVCSDVVYCKQDISQSFTSNGGTLDSTKFYLKKAGTNTGNIYAKLYAHSGTYGTSSVPTGSALATSDAFDASTLTTSFQLITFNFTGANRYSLSNGAYYVIVLDVSDVYSGGWPDITGNKVFAGLDNTSPTHSGNYSYYNASTRYTTSSIDTIFYVYKIAAPSATAVTIGTNYNYGLTIPLAGTAAVNLSDTGGTTAGGILLGADTNLYRSATNTLTTDDSFLVGTNLTVTGTSALQGAATVSKINAASGSADALTLSGTLGAFNGSDTFRGVYLNYTNADHTSTTNIFNGIDIAAITGDAEATETAITVGTGWDYGMTLAVGGTAALNLSSTANTAAGGILFGADTTLYRGAANELHTDDLLAFSSSKAATDVDFKSYKPDTAGGSQFLFNTSAAISSASLLAVQNNGTNRLVLTAAGQLELATQGTTGGLSIGGDTYLYRSAAGTLSTTDTAIYASRTGAAALTANRDDSSRALHLYRASNTATDSTVIGFRLNDSTSVNEEYAYIGGAIVDPTNTTEQGALVFGARNGTTNAIEYMRLNYDGKLYFGTNVAIDTNLYRSAENILKTDDSFVIAGTSADLLTQGDLRYYDADSTNYVGFQAPATVAADVLWTLPSADGGAGECLATNSGTLSWAACGGGSGAPTTSQYLTLALDGSLSAERVLVGTANQVILNDGGANGNLTLSTPQDIGTASNVQFAGLTTTGIAALNGGITVDTSNFTVDGTTGAVSLAAVNAAAGSLNALTLSGTLGIMDGTGSDVFRGAYLNYTNVDHTGGTFYGIDIANITGDAHAIETAINIGTGWDYGVVLAAGRVAALNLASTANTAEGGILFGTDTNLYRSDVNILKTDDLLKIAGVNTANNSADALTLSGTLGILNGSDTFRGIFLDYANANHSGSANAFRAIDIDAITGDAQAIETAINIGTGWDTGITTASGVAITNVNAASGSANALALSGTLGAFNGSDTFSGIDISYTNANHTSTGNTFNGINVGNITGDAEASEYALNIGSGWDAAVNLTAAGSAVDFRSAKTDVTGAQFLFNTSAAVTTASVFAIQENGTTHFAVDPAGALIALATYSTTVGVTNRDLYIDDSGKIGYIESSARYKENITNVSATDWLYDLQPVNYTYINDGTHTPQIGLIAEDVEAAVKDIFPSLISYRSDDPTAVETVNYSQLIVPLLAETQSLNKRVTVNELAIAKLQSDVATLLTDTKEIAGASLDLGSEVTGRAAVPSTASKVFVPTTAARTSDSILVTPILSPTLNEALSLFRGEVEDKKGFWVHIVPASAVHDEITFDWLIIH